MAYSMISDQQRHTALEPLSLHRVGDTSAVMTSYPTHVSRIGLGYSLLLVT